ncbi:GAF domain-containing sensor histidine kinase [Paractinoplanes atraurantiacus]|uniref:histidine kinase n=1 Tax=Paractinoplanes atraurantiacus TaxID=1036182 RepID=A0A285KK78_9ACTN|nr:GAF domain-containing sensor histidine kinase [Actinoplanes atraurantiacus]SNY71806.1 Signal transduction histidine kinase [Actinoplanes atraurantiacus]
MSDTLVAERERVAALHDYRVLDTAPESDFDDIVTLAAQLCRAPMAAISLIDDERQWFKSRIGIEACEVPRDQSFCAHAMFSDGVMQVPDARLDPRFRDNPAVTGDPHVVFYAGAPLITASGQALGALCVIGHEPRLLTPAETTGLRTLARHVMAQLELRQYARGLNARLRDADRVRDEFLSRVTHELRTPLTSINGYLELLGDGVSADGDFVARIRRNSERLTALVDDMLLAAKSGRNDQDGLVLNKRELDLSVLARAAVRRNVGLALTRCLDIYADAPLPVMVEADEERLGQVLERLLLNAVKFTRRGRITVRARVRGDDAVLEIRDTGIGMTAEESARVMAPFRRSAAAERHEVQGAGLGLSIVKAIIDGHHGTIRIDSEPDRGTAIEVTLPRII